MAKVLIIDDDVHVCGMLKSHLSDEGYEVLVAHSGAQGLEEVRKAAPDLIMLDVMLPDLTGFQLCKELRRTSSTQATPIIMMTGVARYPNQQVFGLERGANEYILKPFEIIEVGELVHGYMHRARLEKKASPASQRPKKTPPPTDSKVEDTSHLRGYLNQALSRFKI